MDTYFLINKSDMSKLDEMMDTLIHKKFNNLEFEVLFKSKNASVRKNIDRSGFENVIRRLKSLGLKPVTHPDVLDISFRTSCDSYPSNIRVSINGLQSIRKYCSRNDLHSLGDEVTFTAKSIAKNHKDERIKPLIINDYNLKFNLKYENTKLKSVFDDRRGILDNWTRYYKSFRYKKRYSFKTSTLSIDLTIVKSSNYRDGRPVFTKTFLDSNVITNKPTYEIEIEFIGNEDSYDTDDFKKLLLEDMFNHIRYIYQALEDSFYITSANEKKRVLDEYHKLTNSWYFKAPLMITLEKNQVVKLNDYTNIINIRKDYTVTDKADGIRNLLLFIPYNKSSKNCELYLINRQNNVKKLGIKAPAEYSYTIVDGELITKDINNKTIQLYMAFDIYYLKGESVMPLNLIERVGGFDHEGHLQQLLRELKPNLIKSENNPFVFDVKKFYFGNSLSDKKDDTIFLRCRDILNKKHMEGYPYHIDGLIFTPVQEGVWGKGDVPKKQLRWESVFKWKPPEENSIDFLVKIENDKRGKDRIYSLQENNSIFTYKKCILHVGYDKDKHYNFNAFRIVNENPTYEAGYKPIKFMPNTPYIKESYITFIKTDNNLIFCEDGSQIKDNSIVEFKWLGDELTKWGPLRVRNSKNPNALNTALNVWESIHNPVTEEMITSGKKILVDTDKYYIRQKKRTREELSTFRLQDFHNKYVKTKLLSQVSREGDTLLDVSVGKGGDLHKWVNMNLSFVLGQDISQDGLTDPTNGACVRYLNIKNTKKNYPTVFFVWGDSHKRLSTGESALDNLNKYYLDVLYGNVDKDLVLNKHLNKNWAKAQDKFDIVSCQFAIHYFFKDRVTFDGFLQNIDDNVKLNGYFIGTCLDGIEVFSRLNKTSAGKIGKRVANTKDFIWYINRKYNNITKFKTSDAAKKFFNTLNAKSLGMSIDVYIDSINSVYEEYLVNFKYLTKKLEQLGFELINSDNFSVLFDKLNSETGSYGKALEMTKEEKDLSFLNRQFIFHRTRIPTSVVDTVIDTDIADATLTAADIVVADTAVADTAVADTDVSAVVDVSVADVTDTDVSTVVDASVADATLTAAEVTDIVVSAAASKQKKKAKKTRKAKKVRKAKKHKQSFQINIGESETDKPLDPTIV